MQERSCIMLRFADLLEKHKDEIAALETWDNGKPYEQAANVELPMIIRVFRYYAGRLKILLSFKVTLYVTLFSSIWLISHLFFRLGR